MPQCFIRAQRHPKILPNADFSDVLPEVLTGMGLDQKITAMHTTASIVFKTQRGTNPTLTAL